MVGTGKTAPGTAPVLVDQVLPAEAPISPTVRRLLYRLALATAGSTWILLVAGANVTSTGSGLAVPDWPLAFGQWLPPMVGRVFNEHGHRLIAMAVGSLTLILTLGVLWKEPRPGVRWLAISALGAVIAQGLLGRWTVLRKLPPIVSIGHAALAEAFFCITLALAFVLVDGGPALPARTGQSPLFRWCVAATATTYLQIVLGAVIRHTGSGIPYHVGWLCVLFYVLFETCRRVVQDPAADRLRVRSLAWFAMICFGLQLALGMGAATFIMGGTDDWKGSSTIGEVWTRNGHLGIGALLLATCFLMTLRVRCPIGAEPAPNAESREPAAVAS